MHHPQGCMDAFGLSRQESPDIAVILYFWPDLALVEHRRNQVLTEAGQETYHFLQHLL